MNDCFVEGWFDGCKAAEIKEQEVNG